MTNTLSAQFKNAAEQATMDLFLKNPSLATLLQCIPAFESLCFALDHSLDRSEPSPADLEYFNNFQANAIRLFASGITLSEKDFRLICNTLVHHSSFWLFDIPSLFTPSIQLFLQEERSFPLYLEFLSCSAFFDPDLSSQLPSPSVLCATLSSFSHLLLEYSFPQNNDGSREYLIEDSKITSAISVAQWTCFLDFVAQYQRDDRAVFLLADFLADKHTFLFLTQLYNHLLEISHQSPRYTHVDTTSFPQKVADIFFDSQILFSCQNPSAFFFLAEHFSRFDELEQEQEVAIVGALEHAIATAPRDSDIDFSRTSKVPYKNSYYDWSHRFAESSLCHYLDSPIIDLLREHLQ